MLITEADFNHTFSDNYNNFRYYTSTVMTNNYQLYNDGIDDERVVTTVHDVYEKIQARVAASAVTATTIIGYIKSILRHTIYDSIRPDLSKNKRRFEELKTTEGAYEFHNLSCFNKSIKHRVEDILNDEAESQTGSLEYREKSMYWSKKIFQYLSTRYNDKDQYIFRTYFLMENRMTYQKLSDQTGYSKSTCSNTIKKIKTNLRTHFNDWLKENP